MNVELWNRKSTFQSKFVFHSQQKKRNITCWLCTKSGNSWRLSLKDKLFVLLRVDWYWKQRPPYRTEIAEDFLVLTVLDVERRTEASRSFTARSDLLLTNFTGQNSVFPASQARVNEIKPFLLCPWRKYFVWCAHIILNVIVGFPLLAISETFLRSFCHERIFLLTVSAISS